MPAYQKQSFKNDCFLSYILGKLFILCMSYKNIGKIYKDTKINNKKTRNPIKMFK